MAEVKGFKVFNPDWTCRNKQYTCPGKFEEDVTPMVCNTGMHFCRRAADCFNYYNFNPENHVAEVIAYGDIAEVGDKTCTNKLEIVREIPWSEVLEIVNMGKACTGLWNSGNRNSGDWNSGNQNSGNRNSGNRNSGNRNSGDWNSGNWNSGNCNSGDCNSGDWNSGDCNSGDWNKTSFSNGCFNTEEPEVYMFNKPSGMTYRQWLNSDARYLLEQIPHLLEQIPHWCLVWVWSEDMTNAQIWWNDLDEESRNVIKALPNFDAEIFYQCTGIKVGGEE